MRADGCGGLCYRRGRFPIEDHAENGAVTPEEILDHRPRVLSQAQREFFFAQGYLLVERAIDAAQLTRLREAFAMLETRGEEPECPADFEFETLPDGSRRLRQVLCAADYHPEIWRYVSTAPMTDVAADVVGPNVQFRESGISFKSPGGRGFGWHQDHYDADGKWLGLIGEHVRSRVPVTDSIPITGPAGSVLITSCALVHAADENRTARRRPMVLAGYASADTVPYAGIPYRSRYRWRIVAGEPTREIHSDAQRLKMPPDWDAHQGIRIDNLYQQPKA